MPLNSGVGYPHLNTMRFSIFITLLLVACAQSSTKMPDSASWSDQCYQTFENDVAEIAGVSAIDCGFLPRDIRRSLDGWQSLASSGAQVELLAKIEQCAKSAVESGNAFKFGYYGFGYDSDFCDVAIRGPDGQLISFFFDSDTSGQMGSKGNHSVVHTSSCKTIEFKPGTIDNSSFFDLQECTSSPEIFSALSSSK